MNLLKVACSVSVLASLAFADAAYAACEIPRALRLEPPIVDGEPVKVTADFILIDVIAIKDTDQTFSADLVVSVDWRDPRLAAEALGESLEGCSVDEDEIWTPEFGSINRRRITFIFGPRLNVDTDGAVHYKARMLGDFSSPLDLREFPFDTQDLRVRMASFEYGPREIELVALETQPSTLTDYALAGWNVLGNSVDADVAPARVGSETFSRVDYVIRVKRRAAYYMLNFVLPLIFIVLMAWTVFWLDPQIATVQISISTASAFTLVAFLIALRGRLPPVPYLTRMDKLVLFSTALVFAALAQAVVTSRLAQKEKVALARRFDAYGRWIYLAVFALVLYFTLVR